MFQAKRFMPARAGKTSAGNSRSGHSGGCSVFFFSLLESLRTSLPWASRISMVISSFGSVFK